MRIALVAPPFIPVPPVAYGGTELFIAQLAEGLQAAGHDIIVYANGESRVGCEVRWRYRHMDWPPGDALASYLKNADHTSWAIHDALESADLLHLNDIVGLPFTRFGDVPVVLTLHHPHEPVLTAMYGRYPNVDYVAISAAQARREPMSRVSVAHHGVLLEDYEFQENKDGYLAFLGRMAPCKGAHLAIDVARRAGLPLKLAGEVQPAFGEYWEQKVRPGIDGRQIEYVGEADKSTKNRLLSAARALLFPIQWEEPFGLVMIEAMACGTPVLAFRGGSVAEVVEDGVSGWMCRSVDDMAARARHPSIDPASCRRWAARHFSRDRMVGRYIEIYEAAVARRSSEQSPQPVWKM
jgi:glycosyltransferase involved in cell wall biosynthesis